jgi:hypothetical protein
MADKGAGPRNDAKALSTPKPISTDWIPARFFLHSPRPDQPWVCNQFSSRACPCAFEGKCPLANDAKRLGRIADNFSRLSVHGWLFHLPAAAL